MDAMFQMNDLSRYNTGGSVHAGSVCGIAGYDKSPAGGMPQRSWPEPIDISNRAYHLLRHIHA
jgi:hypothetical protein